MQVLLGFLVKDSPSDYTADAPRSGGSFCKPCHFLRVTRIKEVHYVLIGPKSELKPRYQESFLPSIAILVNNLLNVTESFT